MAAASSTITRQFAARLSTTTPEIAERVELIRSARLFAGLTTGECEKIARLARARTFMRDETLFMQGQPVRAMMLLRSGSVKVTQLGPKGNEVILWMYGCGSAVGMLSEPASGQHSCSACAMEPCTALAWENDVLQRLMAEYPQIRSNATQILALRIRELEERFREVATEKVAKRLSLALLRLLKQIGKAVDGGVEISLTRDELAQMTGTTLFTICRILSKWAEIGFVLPRREAVLVRDSRRLALAGNEEY